MELDIIKELANIIKKCKLKSEEIINNKDTTFYKEYINAEFEETVSKELNKLYKGDNLLAMKNLLDEGYKDKIDLIYIDPPFFTMANYNNRIEVVNDGKKDIIEYPAYTDVWKNGLLEYLEMITIRIFLMKKLLSDKGTIYIHLDFRAVHYIKIIMDCIFGEENFLNEVVWSYKSGGSSNKYFSRKHDTILVYTKSNNYIFNPQKEKSYNRGFKPYRFKNVEEYKDDLGWYTLVNLKDVWDINIVGRTSKERVGYGTQKPEALLERIILSSSSEDSIVADFFGGSGTTAVVAEKNNRRWITSDVGDISIATMKKRLNSIENRPYIVLNSIREEGASNLAFKSIEYEEINEYEQYIKIHLDKYELDLERINIKENMKEKINQILKENSLALIDCLGIGYKSKVNNIVLHEIYKDHKGLLIDKEIKYKIPKDNDKRIFIKTIDVLGVESYKLL